MTEDIKSRYGENAVTFTLLFKNPVFHYGSNVTVRKGEKWAKLRKDNVLLLTDTDTNHCVAIGEVEAVYNMPFFWLYNLEGVLELEHDESCCNVEGLIKEMERVYEGDFTTDDQIVVIFMDVRLINDRAKM